MREIILGLFVLIALLGALDVLAWQGLRQAFAWPRGSRQHRIAAALFWGAAALAPPVLAVGLVFASRGNDAVGWGVVSTVAVLHLPVAALAAAVLAGWAIAGMSRFAVRLAVADPDRRASLARQVTAVRVASLAGVAVAGSLLLLFLEGATLGRNRLVVRRVDACIETLPPALAGLTIAHLSDLHLPSLEGRERLVRRLVDATNEASPDVVVFTGDLDAPARIAAGAEVLGRLRPRLGAFAVLGNHDLAARELAPEDWNTSVERTETIALLRAAFAARGVRLLVNETAALERGGAVLSIVGTGVFDPHHGYRDSDLAPAGGALAPDEVRLLLTHNPELWDSEVAGRLPVALTLAGHTHGGQIGLELGPLRASLASLSLSRWGGLYRAGGQLLYVNRGVGTYGPPLRAGIPAELTLIRLVPATA